MIRPALCLLVLLGGLGGCAFQEDSLVRLPEQEAGKFLAGFERMLERQAACRCCYDAEVTVRFDSFFSSGIMGGYLETMVPAFVKFVGFNPLGQPLLAYVSDGGEFQLLLPVMSRLYSGRLTAPGLGRFRPEGLDPDALFYLLIGRIPPGPLEIMAVSSGEGAGIWFDLLEGDVSVKRTRVMIDPVREVVLRRQIIGDDGQVLLDLSYDRYGGALSCPLPGRIKIAGGGMTGSLEIDLRDWQGAAAFPATDFNLPVPGDFKEVVVQ